MISEIVPQHLLANKEKYLPLMKVIQSKYLKFFPDQKRGTHSSISFPSYIGDHIVFKKWV